MKKYLSLLLALACLFSPARAEEIYTGRTLVSSGVIDATNDKISFHDVSEAAGSRLKVISAALLRTAMGLDAWAGQTRGSLSAESAVTSLLITDGTITNNDIAAGAAIELSKLATNPLARANHTGTQALSTLAQGGATSGQVITWNGSAWAPAAAGGVDQAGNFTWTGTHNFTGGTVSFGTFGTTTLNVITTFQLGGVTVTSSAAELNSVDGVTSNVQTQLDAKADKAIATKASASAYTIGTTDADELRSGVVYVTSTGTQSLPAVQVGMQITIIVDAAVVVTVDPNGSEVIRLNGVDLAAGFAVKSSGAIGEIIVLTYHSSGKWFGSSAEFITNGS